MRPAITGSDLVQVALNVGCRMDISSGTYYENADGSYVLMGGLSHRTGIVGPNHTYKSTVVHFFSLTATSRMLESLPEKDLSINNYDVDGTMSLQGYQRLIDEFPNLTSIYPLEKPDDAPSAMITVSTRSEKSVNDWYDEFKTFTHDKIDKKNEIAVEVPVGIGREKKLKKVPCPSIAIVDTLTFFMSDNTAKKLDNGEIGESSVKMGHMNAGADRDFFVREASALATKSGTFLIMSAHTDNENNIQQNPYAPTPQKQLKDLPSGIYIKGCGKAFLSLATCIWMIRSAKPLTENTSTGGKSDKYPLNKDDAEKDFVDLYVLTMRQVRGKSEISGMDIEVIVSQRRGVRPALTEFHHIKEHDFGISGNKLNYSLDIYPEVKLSRTTVHGKIDNDPKLRRALNITSELLQLNEYRVRASAKYLCTPKELYEGIKEKGYDWNEILETRGYWTPNDHLNPIKRLSTLDLLRMRAGVYTPYWIKK